MSEVGYCAAVGLAACGLWLLHSLWGYRIMCAYKRRISQLECDLREMRDDTTVAVTRHAIQQGQMVDALNAIAEERDRLKADNPPAHEESRCHGCADEGGCTAAPDCYRVPNE